MFSHSGQKVTYAHPILHEMLEWNSTLNYKWYKHQKQELVGFEQMD